MKWTGHSDYQAMKPYIEIAEKNKADAMLNLCTRFNEAIEAGTYDPLLLMPVFILDFLCIHPFNDGIRSCLTAAWGLTE